jgi:hypothetical protein
MAENNSRSGEGATTNVPVDWRRIAVEAAGYVFLAWAALVAINVYAFGDPAARTAMSDDLSHLPQILSHVPRNLGAFFGLIFTLAACIAPGDATLRLFRLPYRDAFDRIAFGLIAGLGVLIAVAYFLAAVQLLRWEIEAALLILGFVMSAIEVPRWLKKLPRLTDEIETPRALVVTFAIVLLAALYVALLSSVEPDVGFDARWYHLAQAERYAQHGGFYNLVASERMWAYAAPHYQETLYAFQWVLFGAVGAKLIAWGGALATVLGVVAFARAWLNSTGVGVLAAMILFASPIVVWSTTTSNNDLGAVPFVILALHALLWWRATGSTACLCATGVFAGITYGIKPFGGFTVVVIGAIVAAILLLRRASRKFVVAQLAGYTGSAVLAVLPALVTAQWMIGDPFFPVGATFFPTQFGASHVNSILSLIATAHHSYLNPVNLLSLPWAITVDSVSFRDLLGPVWLATLPLLLAVPFVARHQSSVIRILAAFVVMFCAFVIVSGAVEFRYAESVLPAVALLIAYGVLCLNWRAARALQAVIVIVIVAFAVLDNSLLRFDQRNAMTPGVMGPVYLNWAYLYDGQPESLVQLQYAPMLQYTNAHLDPRRDKIYDGVHLILMNVYSDVPMFNGSAFDSPEALGEWTLTSPDASARLREAGCTYIVVPREILPSLKHASIWRHLTFVTATPSMNGPKTEDELFKVEGGGEPGTVRQ